MESIRKQDRRRIIRIERIQQGPVITANFSIVGAANENPVVLPPSNPDIDVIEVSCLECDVKINNSHISDGTNFTIHNHRTMKWVVIMVMLLEWVV